jgi:hypothetical protein
MFLLNRQGSWRWAAGLSALIAGLFALAACSTQAAAPGGSALVVGPVPNLLASVNLRLPVQDYLLTDEQGRQVGRARLVLIQQCMKRFGFTYTVAETDAGEYGPRSLTDRRYGITDAKLAATSGYGQGVRDPTRQKRPPTPKLGPDGETVLFGQGRSHVKGLPVPPGGCIGAADRGLDRSAPPGADPDMGQKLQFRSFDWSKENARVQAVFRAWSACMAKAGYDYADPLTVVADPKFTSPAANADEIKVALTDIECKRRTNLVGVWFTVESVYQRQQISMNAAAMQAAAAALAARVRVAGALTGPPK